MQLFLPTNTNDDDVIKLVSLNGNLVKPGIIKNYWVESVYRGLTPRAVSTFYHQSCTPEVGRARVGITGNKKVKCIVNWYEMLLANDFGPSEVDAMYPTYLPKEWNDTVWKETGGGFTGMELWIWGLKFFKYLHQVHDFLFRKLKWPRQKGQPPKSKCMELTYSDCWGNGTTDWLGFLASLPFPSAEEYEAFRKAMLEPESSLRN